MQKKLENRSQEIRSAEALADREAPLDWRDRHGPALFAGACFAILAAVIAFQMNC